VSILRSGTIKNQNTFHQNQRNFGFLSLCFLIRFLLLSVMTTLHNPASAVELENLEEDVNRIRITLHTPGKPKISKDTEVINGKAMTKLGPEGQQYLEDGFATKGDVLLWVFFYKLKDQKNSTEIEEGVSDHFFFRKDGLYRKGKGTNQILSLDDLFITVYKDEAGSVDCRYEEMQRKN
jgi:hypothetical protein